MIMPHMPIEVVFSCIVLMAVLERTLKRPLSSMAWHVSRKIFVVDEALTALIAFVWSIGASRVVAFVVSEHKND